MLKVYWLEPRVYENHPEVFPNKNDPRKIFSRTLLTGNDKEDKHKLDAAQLEIRELVATKDTTRIIQIYFGDNANYWTLIRTLDICQLEKVDTYFNYENGIWIYNNRPSERAAFDGLTNIQHHPTFYVCGTGLGRQLYEETRESEFEYYKGMAKEFYLSGLLFLLMVCFGALRYVTRFSIH